MSDDRGPLPAHAWSAFLAARAYLVRCAHDLGRTPQEILAMCNFDGESHLAAVLDDVKTGGKFQARPPWEEWKK